MRERATEGNRDTGSPRVRGAGPGPSVSRSDRAVSEFAGVAILVSITVLATASVGIAVLAGDQANANALDANFSYQYFDQSSTLIVTFQRGNPIEAGNLTVRGQGSEASWHELANANETAAIGPGSTGSTVQISRGNAFGRPVSAAGGIDIVYVGATNETVLDSWDGT